MKKIIAAAMLLVLSMNLSACCLLLAPVQMVNKHEDEIVMAPTQFMQDDVLEELPDFTEPETTKAPEMTFEEFMEQIEGIWIFEDNVSHMFDDQYRCDVLILSPESVTSAVYPGGADRPGMVTEFEAVSESAFRLGLTYEAGEFMGDYLSESHGEITVELGTDGRLSVQYGQGSVYYLQYGGQDFDEVNATAAQMLGH